MQKYLLFILLLLPSCQNTSNEIIKTKILTAEIRKDEPFEERKFSLMERELEYLMTIWIGEYDNVEQLDFDKYAKNT